MELTRPRSSKIDTNKGIQLILEVGVETHWGKKKIVFSTNGTGTPGCP